MRYVKGWVACIEKIKGIFPHGSRYLYSEPFPTREEAWSWSVALCEDENASLMRIECNEVPKHRLVQPMERGGE
jgi:hypothetical protein